MMRWNCKIFGNKDIGSIGIGAMIVFIAMVLVAGIAASVLIQTSTKLEAQAMTTGSETTKEVSSGIAIPNILAEKNTTGLCKMMIQVRTRAGSDEIDLSKTYIEITDTTTKVILDYDSTHFVDIEGVDDMFSQDVFAQNAYQFGVMVIEDADSTMTSATPVMNAGDKSYLCFRIGTNRSFGSEITERTDMWGMVVPEQGSPGIISFTTPASFNDAVLDLQ
jgi:flagellin FlaB